MNKAVPWPQGCPLQGFSMTKNDDQPTKKFKLSYHKCQSIGDYSYRQEGKINCPVMMNSMSLESELCAYQNVGQKKWNHVNVQSGMQVPNQV